MSAELIQSKIDEAVAAQEAGDFATAILKVRSAQMLLAATPDLRSQNGEEVKWRQGDLDAMITRLQQAAAAQSGIKTQKINYVRSCS